MTTPIRLRLDNASNIYPACLSRSYASLFRLCVSLDEMVDEATLQSALEATVRRIPHFGYTLSNGAFWWYLEKLDAAPKVTPLDRLDRFDFKKNGGYMFRVSADCRRIVLDIFHVLGDGNAALTFLMTLTGEYLRLRHGIQIEYNNLILNPADTPVEKEIEDSFRAFSGLKGALEKNDPAYHIKGTKEIGGVLHNIRFDIPMSELKAYSANMGYTLTDTVTALMVTALQNVHADDPRPRRNVLKVNVPIDLRRIFGGMTLRNYSSYMHLGVDVSHGYFSFEDIIKTVSLQKNLFTMKCNLRPKIARNVSLEDSIFVRSIPRLLKRPVIDTVNRLKGDRYCSQTLSNLGKITLPEAMAAHVREMDFILGRQRGTSGATACIGFGDHLVINFSRGISESSFENYFEQELNSLGIKAKRTEMDLA